VGLTDKGNNDITQLGIFWKTSDITKCMIEFTWWY